MVKKEPGLEWLLPEECGGSGPTSCLLGFTRRKDLQIPQLLADISVHMWEVLWEFAVGEPAIVLRQRPQSLMASKYCPQRSLRGGALPNDCSADSSQEQLFAQMSSFPEILLLARIEHGRWLWLGENLAEKKVAAWVEI